MNVEEYKRVTLDEIVEITKKALSDPSNKIDAKSEDGKIKYGFDYMTNFRIVFEDIGNISDIDMSHGKIQICDMSNSKIRIYLKHNEKGGYDITDYESMRSKDQIKEICAELIKRQSQQADSFINGKLSQLRKSLNAQPKDEQYLQSKLTLQDMLGLAEKVYEIDGSLGSYYGKVKIEGFNDVRLHADKIKLPFFTSYSMYALDNEGRTMGRASFSEEENPIKPIYNKWKENYQKGYKKTATKEQTIRHEIISKIKLLLEE